MTAIISGPCMIEKETSVIKILLTYLNFFLHGLSFGPERFFPLENAGHGAPILRLSPPRREIS